MKREPNTREPEEIDAAVRSLPLKLWPVADKTAWETACQPGARLKGGGAASHMRRVTQNMLAQRYWLFLDFVSRSKRLDQAAEAAGHVMPELVEPYVEELKSGSVRSRSTVLSRSSDASLS
jgi:hypothetical protein